MENTRVAKGSTSAVPSAASSDENTGRQILSLRDPPFRN
jgi:hypothetical protein